MNFLHTMLRVGDVPEYKYELGTAFGHLALGVPDVAAACEKIRAAGSR